LSDYVGTGKIPQYTTCPKSRFVLSIIHYWRVSLRVGDFPSQCILGASSHYPFTNLMSRIQMPTIILSRKSVALLVRRYMATVSCRLRGKADKVAYVCARFICHADYSKCLPDRLCCLSRCDLLSDVQSSIQSLETVFDVFRRACPLAAFFLERKPNTSPKIGVSMRRVALGQQAAFGRYPL